MIILIYENNLNICSHVYLQQNMHHQYEIICLSNLLSIANWNSVAHSVLSANIQRPLACDFRCLLQGDQLYMAMCFWYLLKRDLSSVRCCIVAHISLTFYKVPEQHGLSGRVVCLHFEAELGVVPQAVPGLEDLGAADTWEPAAGGHVDRLDMGLDVLLGLHQQQNKF